MQQANSAALEILAYPAGPEGVPAGDRLLAAKLAPALGERRLCEPDLRLEFFSGGRRYLCRGFPLGASDDRSSPVIALLLEPAPGQLLNAARVAERFHLTRREGQTLALLAQGLSNKEIARELGVSPNTVKAFLRLMMMRMNVDSRLGILFRAMQFLSE